MSTVFAPRSLGGVGSILKSKFSKIIVFVFLFLVFLSFKTPVFAQTTDQTATASTQTQNQYLNPNNESNVPQNLHTWTQNVMIEVMSALSCQLSGVDPTTKDRRCLGTDSKTGKIGYVNTSGGLLGFTTNAIAYLYIPPAHTADYVRYLAGNFGIAKPSYAQVHPGYGIGALAPLQGLWIAFRNLVYVLFIIVFLIKYCYLFIL